MRVKVDYRTASKENYNDFCKKHPKVNISYEDWRFVIYRFNHSIRDYLLETGFKAKLPLGLGEFVVGKKKRKRVRNVDGKEVINLPVNWKKTKEKGKKIYHMNFHTEGYFFGWLWFRRSAMIKYADLWRFKASRITSRLLGDHLKADENNQHKYGEYKYR